MLRGEAVGYISSKISEFFLKLFTKIKPRDFNSEIAGSVGLYGHFRKCFFFLHFHSVHCHIIVTV
jgi:hypothetical protein